MYLLAQGWFDQEYLVVQVSCSYALLLLPFSAANSHFIKEGLLHQFQTTYPRMDKHAIRNVPTPATHTHRILKILFKSIWDLTRHWGIMIQNLEKQMNNWESKLLKRVGAFTGLKEPKLEWRACQGRQALGKTMGSRLVPSGVIP